MVDEITACFQFEKSVKYVPNAPLVAKGYTQTYGNGIDYTETFSSLAKIGSVCIFISLAANLE